LPALLKIALAAVGQADLARGAHKQAHSQALLQPRDRTADRRRRHAGRRGGGRKTAQLRRKAEQLDAPQQHVVEITLHDRLIDYIRYQLSCNAVCLSTQAL
jgi:hypothetical protein